jgi:hypothetical protein
MSEGKGSVGRPRLRWEDNIEMNLKNTYYKGMGCIAVAHDRGQWLDVVSTESTFGFQKRRRIF